MDKQIEDILKGLKTAIEAELTGHEFYKNAAKSTNDPVGKETFSSMAEEEMGHFNYLRHQYKSVLDNGDYDFSKKMDKKQFKHADNPIFSEQIKERIKDSHFEVSALSIGMKLELDAMKYYRSCASAANNEQVRQFYNELAEWEEDHYVAFERQLEMLKEEYFTANNFVPM
ncbi:MAG: ferritin family protein [Desulfobacterales bacterium]|nr:ferritin family protein [Desulfobacterales bacterium]